MIQAVGERQPLIHGNIITNERNLVDMFAGLLIDGAPRSEVVELFIDRCAIPPHRLPALLDDARERHAQLHRQVTDRLIPRG